MSYSEQGTFSAALLRTLKVYRRLKGTKEWSEEEKRRLAQSAIHEDKELLYSNLPIESKIVDAILLMDVGLKAAAGRDAADAAAKAMETAWQFYNRKANP